MCVFDEESIEYSISVSLSGDWTRSRRMVVGSSMLVLESRSSISVSLKG